MKSALPREAEATAPPAALLEVLKELARVGLADDAYR
jgi:hypothetical protein